MGIEDQKPMHRSLMTPGREDLSPWPPVGQLEFDKITAMDEETLDRAFVERHGLSQVINKESYRNKTERRLELKRLILAKLEGYATQTNEIDNWYISTRDIEAENPARTLNVTLNRILTEDAKVRFRDVRHHIAREALVLVPSEELQEIEQKIARIFLNRKLKPLKVSEILNINNLPIAKPQSEIKSFDIKSALSFYLLMLQGVSTVDAARRVGIRGESSTLSGILSITFSKEAKEALKK